MLVIQLKKTDYNTRINEIEKKITDHDKCITTTKFNRLTAENFALGQPKQIQQAEVIMLIS